MKNSFVLATKQDFNALEVAREAAELASRACKEFPDCPPSQSFYGGLVARKPSTHV